MADMQFKNMTEGLFSFIEKSPTGFHVVKNAAAALEAAGYRRLNEGDAWETVPGGKYYLTRGGASLIAFVMPDQLDGFMLAAAHTDSPCLHLKENAGLFPEGYTKLDTEKYGGMIISCWLDRPLSVAGRLFVREGENIRSVLVNVDRDLMVVPSLAIHMDRTINDGKKLTMQTDLLPLLGLGQRDILAICARAAGVAPEEILSHDLYVYNRQKGTILGEEGELILCPRLDDQMCVYGLLQGFLAHENPRTCPVLCLFDNEEVGSMSLGGAQSTFLRDTLRRIGAAAGADETALLRAFARSMMLSADNAHAIHPNHPEKADPKNHPLPGAGVVVKFGTAYASDGHSAALVRAMMDRKGIPHQTFFNHSDIPGGGTLGKLALVQNGIATVDIGLAQLAMHSSCETAGSGDVEALSALASAFFSSAIRPCGDGAAIEMD